MNSNPKVQRLTPCDADAFVKLRMEALEQDPLAFAASPEDDRALSIEFVREALGEMSDQAVFGAFVDEVLVGITGIYREPKLKRHHFAHIWGVYVTSSARGKGLARALMQAAINQARQWDGVEFIELGAATNTPAPIRLYESLGFRTWGVEVKAVKWKDKYADDAQMVLEL